MTKKKAVGLHPPVTVILPVLNGEKLLPKCLDSLKAQDYPWAKIRLIVVDDLSMDNTIAEALQEAFKGSQIAEAA